MNDLTQVPARQAKAQRVDAGQHIQIVNTHGTQVVDTWAFNADDLGEWMSMEHTRATIDKMMPDLGEAFLTNRRHRQRQPADRDAFPGPAAEGEGVHPPTHLDEQRPNGVETDVKFDAEAS